MSLVYQISEPSQVSRFASLDPLRRARRLLFMKCIAVALIAATGYGWFLIYAAVAPRFFSVSFLKVGQGDAILLRSPSGRDMLIDGGPDRKVLGALSEALPWNDRSIDIVLNTHPDSDHLAGLAPVLEKYTVGTYIDTGIRTGSALQKNVLALAPHELVLTRGHVIDFGDGLFVHVLFPERGVSEWKKTNNSSFFLKVVYGTTSVFLSGDAADTMEKYVVRMDGGTIQSTILKAGHHGSKTSNSAALLDAVQPELFVISAGKGNRYGHPHEETLERVRTRGIPIIDTTENTVTFLSDGKKMWRQD